MTKNAMTNGHLSHAPRGSDVASVLAGALCLSLSAVLVGLAGVDAPTTAFLRCALALLALVPLAWRERRRHGSLGRVGAGWAIAAGIALGIDYGAWTASIYAVGAGVSTVLINVQVIVLPLLAFFVDRERVPRRFVVAAPLMLAGLALVGGVVGRAPQGSDPLRGTVLGLLAGTGYGVYLYLTRRGGRARPGLAVTPLAWATGSAAATTALLAPVSGGLHLAGIGARAWTCLLALALIGQVVSWLLIHRGSAHLPAGTTAALLMIQPVIALILGAVVLGERPGIVQWVGAAVVLAALAHAQGLTRR